MAERCCLTNPTWPTSRRGSGYPFSAGDVREVEMLSRSRRRTSVAFDAGELVDADVEDR